MRYLRPYLPLLLIRHSLRHILEQNSRSASSEKQELLSLLRAAEEEVTGLTFHTNKNRTQILFLQPQNHSPRAQVSGIARAWKHALFRLNEGPPFPTGGAWLRGRAAGFTSRSCLI